MPGAVSDWGRPSAPVEWERMIGAAQRDDPAYYGRFETQEACRDYLLGHAREMARFPAGDWTWVEERERVVLDSWSFSQGQRVLLSRKWMECRPPASWRPATPTFLHRHGDGLWRE
jgi:hypothetical protein